MMVDWCVGMVWWGDMVVARYMWWLYCSSGSVCSVYGGCIVVVAVFVVCMVVWR